MHEFIHQCEICNEFACECEYIYSFKLVVFDLYLMLNVG